MDYGKVFRTHRYRLTFQSWMAVFLLFLYITGTISTDLVHQIVHGHHDVELHSTEHEKDPCHQAIYHHDTSKGCKHETHITNIEKCKHCHILFHADQLTLPSFPHKSAFQDLVVLIRLISVTLPGIDFQQSLRGPPAI